MHLKEFCRNEESLGKMNSGKRFKFANLCNYLPIHEKYYKKMGAGISDVKWEMCPRHSNIPVVQR